MKKPYLYLSVLLLASLSITGHAQTQDQQVPYQAPAQARKKIVKYNESTNEVVEVQAPAQQQQQVQQQESPSPVYIVNSPKYAAPQQAVQEQPTTTIEASSLNESKADQLRKSRQNMEVQTEQKIVEKLEEARIQDEKARADRLFGASLAAPTPAPTPQPTPQLAPPPIAPQAQQQPPVVVVEKQEVEEAPVDDRASIKEEVKKALDEAKLDSGEPKQNYYIGGLVGVSEVPDAANVRGTGSGGVTVGTITPEGWIAEGNFMYNTYDLEDLIPSGPGGYPPFKSVTQYDFSLGAKYQFFTGKLRPNVGVLASYSYRKYQDKDYSYVGSDDASSNALDVGLSAGLDLMITKTFSIGVDFKYLTNVAYNTNSNYQQSFVNPLPQGGTPLEKLDYYTASLAGKVTF